MLVNLRPHTRYLVAAFALALLVAGCGGSNAASTDTAPAPSSARVQASSLWTTTQLSYPEDPVASTSKDVGERSFPYRDLRLPIADLQLADASDRFALLTDWRSQQLRLVDLRTGKVTLLLAAPRTVDHPPSVIWVKAREALRAEFSARFATTEVFSAQIAGRQVVWQEALCIRTGGFAMEAWALYSARLTPERKLGPAQLLALAQPPYVPSGRPAVDWPQSDLTLDYALQQDKLLLIRGVGRGVLAEVIDLRSGRRTGLLDVPRRLWGVDGAFAGQRVVISCLTSEDTARLLLYDLADGGLPCGVADLPKSHLEFTDLRGFALDPQARIAWSKWYTPSGGDDTEAVFLLSPDGKIECLSPVGGEPVFFGSTVLWGSLTGNRSWLGGADLAARERFTVAGADHLGSWSVAGDGHAAVVLVKPAERGSSTLRVFDVP
jgi:hypothetical protein